MGFLDKVKEQALELKEKVGDTVNDAQAKHKANELLERLGRLTYAERTGRADPEAPAEIEQLISELAILEEEGVAVLAPPPPPPAAADGPPPPPPAAADGPPPPPPPPG